MSDDFPIASLSNKLRSGDCFHSRRQISEIWQTILKLHGPPGQVSEILIWADEKSRSSGLILLTVSFNSFSSAWIQMSHLGTILVLWQLCVNLWKGSRGCTRHPVGYRTISCWFLMLGWASFPHQCVYMRGQKGEICFYVGRTAFIRCLITRLSCRGILGAILPPGTCAP